MTPNEQFEYEKQRARALKLRQQSQSTNLEEEVGARNPLAQEMNNRQPLAPPPAPEKSWGQTIGGAAKTALKVKQDMEAAIPGGVASGVKHMVQTGSAMSEQANAAIAGIRNPVLKSILGGVNTTLNPVGSRLPQGTAQNIGENVPEYQPNTGMGSVVKTGAEIATGMLGPGKFMKAPEAAVGFGRLMQNLARFSVSQGGGVAAVDEDVAPLVTGPAAEWGNLLGQWALDEKGEYNQQLLERKLNLLAEAFVLAKPAEVVGRGAVGFTAWLTETTLGNFSKWQKMAPKMKQAAMDFASTMVKLNPLDSNDKKQKILHGLADYIRKGSEVDIPSDIPGVDSVKYQRPTAEAAIAGGLDDPQYRARAAGLQAETLAKGGADQLEAAIAQPSLALDKVTKQSREAFGGRDTVEQGRKAIMQSADDDVANYTSEVTRLEDDITKKSRDVNDVVATDPMLKNVVGDAEQGYQLDLGKRVDDTVDEVGSQFHENYGKRVDKSRELYESYKGDGAKADMKSFRDAYKTVQEFVPKDIKDLISKADGSYYYLKNVVYPELSDHADDLFKGNQGRVGKKIRGLADNIKKEQEAALLDEGEGVATMTQSNEADDFFKSDVAPYRQGTAGELVKIGKQSFRNKPDGTKEILKPDELKVKTRETLRGTFDNPRRAEYTKRVFELVDDPKLKGDYVLGNIAEKISDTITSKGVDAVDMGSLAKEIRQYYPMLEPDQIKRLEGFLTGVTDKRGKIKELQTVLKQVTDETAGAKKQIRDVELKNFFDEEGLQVSNADDAFGQYFGDKDGVNKIKQLMNRMRSRNDPELGDSMKSAYAEYMKRKLWNTGVGPAGEKRVNETLLKDLGSGDNKLLEMGDVIYGRDSTMMKMYRGLLDEVASSGNVTGAKKMPMSPVNKDDLEAKKGIDLVITQIFGQLSRAGARIRSGVGNVISGNSSKNMTLEARAFVMANPEEAAKLIDEIAVEYGNAMDKDAKIMIYRYMVNNGLLSDIGENEFLKDWTDIKPEPVKEQTSKAFNIDKSRPILENPDGTFSTEETATRQDDNGKWVVFPTIVNGKRMNEDNAWNMYTVGKNKAVGTFDSLEESESYARKRSEEIGRVREKDRR